MSEREPSLAPQESEAQLNRQEKQDLNALWVELGTGNTLDIEGDNESIRIQMWRDIQETLLEKTIPKLEGFTRNNELENAVTEAPQKSPERAATEFVLITDYIKQIGPIPDRGFSTTPKLSEKYGYNLDCVMKSSIIATLCEKVGMEVYRGSVAGHAVTLIRDSIGEMIYADPNGTVQKLTTAPEHIGAVAVFVFNEVDQENIPEPYNVIIQIPPELGFVSPMLTNLDRNVLETHDDTSKQLFTEHAKVLDTQSWDAIEKKLYPELHILHEGDLNSLREKEREEVGGFHDYDMAMRERIKKEMVGEGSKEEYQALSEKILYEIRSSGEREHVTQFLLHPEHYHLPPILSPETQKMLQVVSRELEESTKHYPRLKRITITRFVKLLH